MKLPASVAHRAYTRCKSTVLKRARVHDAPHTVPFDQELATQIAADKLRAQIDMEKRALDTFLRSAPLLGHQNAARVHQLRRNEHVLRTRRIMSLEKRLEELLKTVDATGPKHVERSSGLAESEVESVQQKTFDLSKHLAEHAVAKKNAEKAKQTLMRSSFKQDNTPIYALAFAKHLAEHAIAKKNAEKLKRTQAEPTTVEKVEPTIEPTIELIAVPTVEPTVEPTIEPTIELIAAPTIELIAVPIVELKAEPTIELIAVPTIEPTIEPIVELIAAPVAELAAVEPIVELIAAPTVELKAAPIVEPIVLAAVEPIVEPIVEPTIELKAAPVVELKAAPVVEPVKPQRGEDQRGEDQRASVELEMKLKKMETRVKEMEEALRLAGNAAEAAKLVLKLRAQLKRANVEEIEWDFMAEGAYEAAMAEHAKVTAWLDGAPQVTPADKRAYFENEKMQDTWLNRAMMTPRYAEIIQEQKDAWRLANMAENEHALNFIRESHSTAEWSVRFREERSRMFRFVCNTDTEHLRKAHPSDFINVVPNKPDERELRALYFVVTTIKFKNEAKALNLAEEVYNILTSSTKTARKEYGAYTKKLLEPVQKLEQKLEPEPEQKLEQKLEQKPEPIRKKAINPMMGGLMAELGAKLTRRKSAMDEPSEPFVVEEEPKKVKKEPVRKEPPLTRRASSAMFAEMQSKLLLSGPFSKKNADE